MTALPRKYSTDPSNVEITSVFRVTPIGVNGDHFPVRLMGRDTAAAVAAAAARSVDDSVEVVSLIRFNKAKFAEDRGRISELRSEKISDSSAGGSEGEDGPEDTEEASSATSATETNSPSNTIRRSRSRTRRTTAAAAAAGAIESDAPPVRLEDPTGDPHQLYRRHRHILLEISFNIHINDILSLLRRRSSAPELEFDDGVFYHPHHHPQQHQGHLLQRPDQQRPFRRSRHSPRRTSPSMQSRSLDRLSSAVAEDDSCVSITRDTSFRFIDTK